MVLRRKKHVCLSLSLGGIVNPFLNTFLDKRSVQKSTIGFRLERSSERILIVVKSGRYFVKRGVTRVSFQSLYTLVQLSSLTIDPPFSCLFSNNRRII